MKAAAFDYVSPLSASEAVAALAASREGKLLAGGQSLAPMMHLRLAMPSTLIDIRRLGHLRQVEDRGSHHAIGAGITHAAIEDGLHPLSDHGMLQFVARDIAFRAVRNRGTIGGSLAHADPAADWLTALIAIGAELDLHGPNGRRSTPLHGFVLGAFTTALATDELIEAVVVPKLSPGAVWGYHKICRKTGAFADAIGAVVLDPARGYARVVAGAVGGAPLVLDGLAREVAGRGIAAVTLDGVSNALAAIASGLDRVERHLHVVALTRALRQALSR